MANTPPKESSKSTNLNFRNFAVILIVVLAGEIMAFLSLATELTRLDWPDVPDSLVYDNSFSRDAVAAASPKKLFFVDPISKLAVHTYPFPNPSLQRSPLPKCPL